MGIEFAIDDFLGGAGDGRGAPPAEETDEIDFYQASGITQPELEGFLEGLVISSNLHDYPLNITLQNDQGDYLADSRTIVRWDGGEQRLLVGKSAVIQMLLEKRLSLLASTHLRS